MFDRFTTAARSVMVRSEQEARELGHPVILSGHMLLALSSDGIGRRVLARAGFRRNIAVRRFADGIGERLCTLNDDDAESLRTFGIDLDEIRHDVQSAFGTGAVNRNDPRRNVRRPPFSAESKRALESALREAIRLADTYIGTEHLLLGVVKDDESSAGALRRAQGIDADVIRRALAEEIAGGDQSLWGADEPKLD
jgi:ATP-dependent Clp protease ATP-binding subunit ClpA